MYAHDKYVSTVRKPFIFVGNNDIKHYKKRTIEL